MRPDLFGRKTHQRRHGAPQGVRNAVQGGLRRASPDRASRRRVQPVFQDVEIEGAHGHRSEIVDRAIDLVKGVFLVRCLHRFKDLRCLDQRPGVDLLQLVAPHTVPLRIEVVEVREAIAKGVAQLEVSFGQAGENLGRHHHVFAKVH